VWESIPIHTGRTNATGTYELRNVETGWYLVQEVDAEGYTSFTPNIVSLYIDVGVTGFAYFGDLPLKYIYVSYVVR